MIFYEPAYTPPVADQPLSHARIMHRDTWLNDVTVTASTETATRLGEFTNNMLSSQKWEPTALPATLEHEAAVAAECDYCAIGAHTLGTNGAVIRVEYWDGSLWEPLSGDELISDDEQLLFIFTPTTGSRFRVNVLSASGGTPYIGVVKFGKAFQMPRPMNANFSPPRYARTVETTQQRNRTGEVLAWDIKRVNQQSRFTWNIVETTWVELNFKALQQALEASPFFIAWRPDAFDHVDLMYCTTSPREQFVGRFRRIEMEVMGYLNA